MEGPGARSIYRRHLAIRHRDLVRVGFVAAGEKDLQRATLSDRLR